jgi:cysteinyl-tRNA synthetase
MHNGFVNIDREKMSKSLGNFFTVKDVLAKFPPDAVRFFLLSTHYRSPIDFSDRQIREAQKGLERFYDFFRFLERFRNNPQGFISTPRSDPEKLLDIVRSGCEGFEKNMDDDFNTAGALGALFQMVRDLNSEFPNTKPGPNLPGVLDDIEREIRALGEVLGLFVEKEKEIPEELVDALGELIVSVKNAPPKSSEFGDMMREVIGIRLNSRNNKNWTTADAIRNGLNKIGVQLEDHPGGTDWKIVNE